MPKMEPAPNRAMNMSPAVQDCTAPRLNTTSAAEPAIPCVIPQPKHSQFAGPRHTMRLPYQQRAEWQPSGVGVLVRQMPVQAFASVTMGVDMAHTSPVGMDVDVDPLAQQPAQHVSAQQDQH